MTGDSHTDRRLGGFLSLLAVSAVLSQACALAAPVSEGIRLLPVLGLGEAAL